MVLEFESIFSRTNGCQTTKLAHILRSKPKIYTVFLPNGASKQDVVFTCPSAIIYKFYLPGAMGQAPMSCPVSDSK